MERAVAFADLISANSTDNALMLRAIKLVGFGGREAGEVLIDMGDRHIGTLLGGRQAEVVDRLRNESTFESHQSRLIEIELGDVEAVRAGLACGGVATVLAQRISHLPNGFVDALAKRVPATLITDLDEGVIGSLVGIRDGLVEQFSDRVGATIGERARQLHNQTRDLVEEYELGGARVVIEVFAPPTKFVIIGSSGLSKAIASQVQILGWSSVTRDDAESATTASAELGPNDALILLSHDHDLTTPVVAAAVAKTPQIYIGSLGSRHTQAERRRRLTELGVSVDSLVGLHGPVGLDLGSKTPPETALAIAAEFLAYRTGRSASSLRFGDGPING